ncbi:DUF1775 domain-containing protein [Oerskovia flava]|uniref:DUF1775 domain-containing protein n=1 Tax=Oerskovia flava TaxID=2986422 RepID=UPI002240376E|nr:DUF1775 domain-containing protein [Oerskovia sp. JB1-3-2]
MTTHPRPLARLTAVGALAGLLLLVGAPTAQAHVIIESVAPQPDGTVTLTFTFDHGCDGEATDRVDVALPTGVVAVGASQPDGWTSTLGEGAVSWTGDPVPDGDRAELTLDVRVTGEIGQAFVFPTTQHCPSGAQYAWADTDPAGAHPAPSFVATAAVLSPAAPPSADGGVDVAALLAGIGAVGIGSGVAASWYVRRDRIATSRG